MFGVGLRLIIICFDSVDGQKVAEANRKQFDTSEGFPHFQNTIQVDFDTNTHLK